MTAHRCKFSDSLSILAAIASIRQLARLLKGTRGVFQMIEMVNVSTGGFANHELSGSDADRMSLSV